MQTGQNLSHYEILEPIGKGGMGEVYQAHDSKLGRDVAIKVLPDELAQDEERLRRFQREAKVLASLNHPNIAAIHGLERSGSTHYLVLELVPGETLAERIARGRIPFDEALEIATKVAEALEEAHEHGIVHRDLKPANIKLTPDGKVKVLDFGLAKAFTDESPEADSSMSPTRLRQGSGEASAETGAGVILGTAAYMSPEQAKGKRVDRRTDNFAFGAVLYEMLTGRKAFAGEDVSDVLASVIKLEPEWGSLPNELPATAERLIRRCLKKDANQRLQHIGDARIEIGEALAEPTPSAASAEADSVKRPNRLTAVAAIVSITAIAIAIWSLTRFEAETKTVTRTAIPLPPDNELFVNHRASNVAISPDGQKVAYISASNGTTQLNLRAIDELEGKAISGTEGAQMPFFSSDSRWLGFHGNGKLMKVAVTGGAPQTIAEVGSNVRGACWTSEGEIVFNRQGSQGLSRVRAEGGVPELLTSPNRDRREKTHRFPEPLPGGKSILFTLGTGDIDSFDDASIAVLSLETGEYRVVLEGGTRGRYSPSGHLVYARGGSLLAVPFDADEARLTGSPIPVVDGVAFSPVYGSAPFSISRNGSLLYARGDIWGADDRVVWADRSGEVQPLIETPRAYTSLDLSPDGRFLALYIEGANANVWVHDLARQTSTRLTLGFDNFLPVWTPDGTRVTFVSTRTDPANVFWQPADGSGEVEQLTMSERHQDPSSWSPDGNTLALIERSPTAGTNINVLSLEGDRTPQPFLHTDFNETWPAFSPDGRWIAYVSDESGQREIYLRPFPSGEGKRQVSTGGGQQPVWNPNGGELFYLNQDRLMVVDVETDGELTLGEPSILFERSSGIRTYDVAPDGERFALIVPGESQKAESDLILVQNWTEELNRLVPADH